jgi:Eukaryotic cytochrome b561
VIEWLFAPISGAPNHGVAASVAWHGRLMVLSWSFLLPLGILAARYFKITPNQNWPRVLDNKIWWRTHVWVQSAGVATMTLGVVFALSAANSADRVATVHHVFGWTVFALGWLQVGAALLRGDKGGPTEPVLRGDHYDMTPRRVVFERVHKTLGWIAIPLAVAATGLGLTLADAPRWMPLVLALWWLALIGAGVALQKAGRCIDTYQAIWGPDPAHPGARRKPIGFGVAPAKAWRRMRDVSIRETTP